MYMVSNLLIRQASRDDCEVDYFRFKICVVYVGVLFALAWHIPVISVPSLLQIVYAGFTKRIFEKILEMSRDTKFGVHASTVLLNPSRLFGLKKAEWRKEQIEAGFGGLPDSHRHYESMVFDGDDFNKRSKRYLDRKRRVFKMDVLKRRGFDSHDNLWLKYLQQCL